MSRPESLKNRLSGLVREFYTHRREHILFILSLLVAAVISVFLLDFFMDLTEELEEDQLLSFDKRISEWTLAFRTDSLTPIVKFITDLGDRNAYILLMPVIGALLYMKGHKWALTIQGVIVLLSASLLNIWIKNEISRPRPGEDLRLVEVHSYSFPSGHSMSAIAFYGFLIYLTFKLVNNKALKYSLIVLEALLILAIGMSRIYLGVHYPSDVLAGFTAGLFWLLVCIGLFRIVTFYRRKSEPSEE